MDEELMINENEDKESLTDILLSEDCVGDGSIAGKVIIAAVGGIAAIGAAIYLNRGKITAFFDNRAIKRLEKHGHSVTKVEKVDAELQSDDEE